MIQAWMDDLDSILDTNPNHLFPEDPARRVTKVKFVKVRQSYFQSPTAGYQVDIRNCYLTKPGNYQLLLDKNGIPLLETALGVVPSQCTALYGKCFWLRTVNFRWELITDPVNGNQFLVPIRKLSVDISTEKSPLLTPKVPQPPMTTPLAEGS